jgi:hypothetical protein
MAPHTLRVHCALPEALFIYLFTNSSARAHAWGRVRAYLLEDLDQSIYHLALFEAHVVDVVRLHSFGDINNKINKYL